MNLFYYSMLNYSQSLKLWKIVFPILEDVPDLLPKLWKVVFPILEDEPDNEPQL